LHPTINRNKKYWRIVCGLLLLYIFIGRGVFAQNTLNIKVADKTSGGALPYVNGLILQDSTQLSQKFITDKAGNYQVQNLQPGNYRVSLSYTCYLKMDTAIQISNSKEQEQVPKQGRAQQLFIYLTPKFSQLSAVKIKAQKPYLEMDKGKFILNVQQSALAKSSSAWDALKYAPTVITLSDSSK
jgi:hypothetical protein